MPTLEQLCTAVKGEMSGSPGTEITGIASLETAGPTDIAPIENEKYLRLAGESKAGAFLLPRKLGEGLDRPCLFSEFPLATLNGVIEAMDLQIKRPAPGAHPTAIVDPDADVGEGCHFGAYVVVHAGAKLGKRCVLHAHTVVEGDVVIGDDCQFEPGAVIHNGARLGSRVTVGAHAVISRQGFGFAPSPEGPVKLHHIGLTVLGDDVQIGAGTTVDRARFDETRIGNMSGLDNQIQIGHNCTIGERSFLAAQTGMAGNSHVGSDCEIGGQVGIANQSGVGDRCRVAAKSGLMRMWEDDSTIFGYPAFDRRESMQMLSALRKLAKRGK